MSDAAARSPRGPGRLSVALVVLVATGGLTLGLTGTSVGAGAHRPGTPRSPATSAPARPAGPLVPAPVALPLGSTPAGGDPALRPGMVTVTGPLGPAQLVATAMADGVGATTSHDEAGWALGLVAALALLALLESVLGFLVLRRRHAVVRA